MPYWEIFTPENALTDEDKERFATDITKVYQQWVDLPAFYVVVRFQEMPSNSMYVGGKPTTKFVRVLVDHIARRMDDPEFRKLAMAAFEETMAPYIKERGFDWEIHIDETPMDLWRTQGITPPKGESEEEKLWAKENRAIPWEEMAAMTATP